MKLNIIFRSLSLAVLTAAAITGCTPDEVKSGNPLTQADLDAAFTSTSADNHNYTFTGSTDADIAYHVWKWSSVGGDTPPQDIEKKGTNTISYSFTKAGTYTVQHRVVGRIGGTNSVSEETIVVATTAEVLGPNLIASPNFENSADWTVLRINQSGTAHWAFADGKATISGATGHEGIYQAINVVAGKTYRFDMRVQGPGSSNTWFEVYVSPTAPTHNSDYSAGGKRLQLNTWAGCATSPFNGLLSEVGCGRNEVSGNVMTFAQSGTVYFLIKSGESGGNINSISVSEVVFQTID